MSWAEFYAGREGPEYVAYVRDRYKPFLDLICENSHPGDWFVELGSGLGTVTRALHDMGCRGKFHLVDNDVRMMRTAMVRCPWATPMINDIRYFSYPGSITHSHGVLEHFGDAEVRKVLAMAGQWPMNRWQFHYVPGEYPQASYGDERLMSAQAWREITGAEVRSFNDGLDHILILRGNQ